MHDPPMTSPMPVSRWLAWVRELQTMAQVGLSYARDPYDVAGYLRMDQIAMEMLVHGADVSFERAQGLFESETGHTTLVVGVPFAVRTGTQPHRVGVGVRQAQPAGQLLCPHPRRSPGSAGPCLELGSVH